MKLGEIIANYRRANGLSQRQFAEKCNGITNGYISMIENNRNPITNKPISPKLDKLKRIADGMGISLNDLLEMADDMPVDLESSDVQAPDNLIPIKRVRIPLIGGIAAGEPILAEQEYDTYIEADEDIHCTYALRVDGDSMEPTIRLGDVVFIRQQDDVDDGQIAAVLIDDSATLKRVFHIENGLQLLSDNTAKYPPIVITYPEHDTIRILGKAVAFKRML